MASKPFFQNCSTAFLMPELLDINKPVEVYKNLHRSCWSVRQGGIVRLHTKLLALQDCEFKVSEAGRQRVLREKRKNVHAVIKGTLMGWGVLRIYGGVIRYNPYTMSTFTKNGQPILTANAVALDLTDGSHSAVCELI